MIEHLYSNQKSNLVNHPMCDESSLQPWGLNFEYAVKRKIFKTILYRKFYCSSVKRAIGRWPSKAHCLMYEAHYLLQSRFNQGHTSILCLLLFFYSQEIPNLLYYFSILYRLFF